MGARSAFEQEAQVLTRYLFDRECPPDCVDAYQRAHELPTHRGWQQPLDPASRFALAHPWTIEFVDAAAAITGRAPVLRAKLLLMSAILETTPDLAEAFLPRRESALASVLALAWNGLRSIMACVVGIPLVLAVGREAS